MRGSYESRTLPHADAAVGHADGGGREEGGDQVLADPLSGMVRDPCGEGVPGRLPAALLCAAVRGRARGGEVPRAGGSAALQGACGGAADRLQGDRAATTDRR